MPYFFIVLARDGWAIMRDSGLGDPPYMWRGGFHSFEAAVAAMTAIYTGEINALQGVREGPPK